MTPHPNLLEALDKLIEKYSNIGEGEPTPDPENCPLCMLDDMDCINCPNSFFNHILGCRTRSYDYDNLSYDFYKNYPTLKNFWTEYRTLYLQGMDNRAIMRRLIFEELPKTVPS